MGFWEKLKSSIAYGNKPLAYGGILSDRMIREEDAEKFRSEIAIHSSVRIISSIIAQCEWYSKDPRINAFLKVPNGAQTQFEFIHSVIEAMLVFGSAPQRVISNGESLRMLPLEPDATKRVLGENGTVSYEYKPNNSPHKRFSESDVCYFVDIPSYKGQEISRVESARTRINGLLGADRNILSIFDNGVTASWLIESEGALSDEAMKGLMEQLRSVLGNSGGSRTGGVLILQQGVKATRVQTGSPADSDLRDLRQDFIREIAAALGAPPFLVGGTSDTKYNNVSARMVSFFRETASPIITNVKQRLSVATKGEVLCDTSALEAGDLRSQVEIGTRATGGKPIWTQNEAREKLGMPRVNEESADVLGTDTMPNNDNQSTPSPSDEGSGSPEEE